MNTHINASDETTEVHDPLDEMDVPETAITEADNYKAEMDEKISLEAASTIRESATTPFDHAEVENLQKRWNEIQHIFVDEPRISVQQADALVGEVIEKITQTFAAECNSLGGKWQDSTDISTEDLRQVLQDYRAFFNHLLV
jgi:hypothetical protein